MRRRREATFVVLLLVAAGVALSGCPVANLAVGVGTRLASEDTVVIKPEYEIGNKSIVVVPFRDRTQTHYASPDGVDLATYVIGELVNRNAAENIAPDTGVQQMFTDGAAPVPWDKVAAQVGAQLVLTGTLERFRLRDPNTQLMLRGNCVVTAFIYDAKSKAVVHRIGRMEVWWPDWGPGVPEHDMTPEQVREQLLAATATKIVQKYYKWEKKTGPQHRRY